MTATLPTEIQEVFGSFLTTELTTIDGRGQPITWPVNPYYSTGGPCISVTTGIGYPKKARDAGRNPKVSLLFSDPTGSGLERAPMVLVQGTAHIDDADLEANRERYIRESAAKHPALAPRSSPSRSFDWYFKRIYVDVRPERVYLWPDGDAAREPELLDSHMEEVRSGHDEEPEGPPHPPDGGGHAWSARIEEIGRRYRTGVLSIVAPDGFPFSVRVPLGADRRTRLIHLDGDAVGAPLQPGLACITAHDHDPGFDWQRNFQVRGDLVEHGEGWALVPHRVVDGFELPPTGAFRRAARNLPKVLRFRRKAKQEMAKRP